MDAPASGGIPAHEARQTERLPQALLSRIAAPGCVAVIPSSCTEFGRKSLRLAEWPAVSGYLELCTRARAAHLVSLRVTKCRAWTKNNVFCSKVYAVAEAEIEVYRPGCTEPVLSKMEKQAMEAKRWFEPNEDKCLAMLNLCTKRLAEKISADVLDAIGCGPEAEAQAAEKGGRAAQPKQAKGR